MTHHATNLDLPGEANITTAAGDVGVFQSTGANTVQCISYVKADGTPVVSAGIGTIPAFRVTKDGAQSLNTSTWTKVDTWTEVFDTNSDFASGNFLPTVAGKYLLIGRVSVESTPDGTLLQIAIYTNSSLQASVQLTVGGEDSTQTTIAIIVDANGSDDDYELWANQNDASARSISGGTRYTSFEGFKIAE
jgi:hypothetical protein